MKTENTWIIGDIHGEIALLDRLLEHIGRFEPHRLVFVGDYIDRGPAVKEVIDRILGLDEEVVCLMGNHELMMLNALDDLGYGGSPVELWYYNGAEATLLSFGCTSFFNLRTEMGAAYQDFFRDLAMSHTIEFPEGLKVLVTHAGISPAIPLEEHRKLSNYEDLNRYMLEQHLHPGDSFLWVREAFFEADPSAWEGYLVVHGHTPVPKLQHFVSRGDAKQFRFVDNDLAIRWKDDRIASIDIDSGSFVSGRLSGLGFFTEEDEQRKTRIRMRSLTVSGEDLFPRDLGWVPGSLNEH